MKDFSKELKEKNPRMFKEFSEWLFLGYRTQDLFDYGKISNTPVIEQFIGFPFEFQLGVFLRFLEKSKIAVSFDVFQYTSGFRYAPQVKYWMDGHGNLEDEKTQEMAYKSGIMTAFKYLENKPEPC